MIRILNEVERRNRRTLKFDALKRPFSVSPPNASRQVATTSAFEQLNILTDVAYLFFSNYVRRVTHGFSRAVSY